MRTVILHVRLPPRTSISLFQDSAKNLKQIPLLRALFWLCWSPHLAVLPYIKSDHTSSVEENISIIVACVPTLGPFFEFFSDKVKSLKSRRHHTQLKETAPSLRKGDPIPLRSNTDPIRPVTDYESSAEPLGKSCQGIYGSQIGLVHGIQRTTRVDVLRGDKPV